MSHLIQKQVISETFFQLITQHCSKEAKRNTTKLDTHQKT